MTITFEHENKVIVYALEKIISFAREKQYYFVANCAWWIAGVLGLESGLIIFIDNLKDRESKRLPEEPTTGLRVISATPRDIARNVSPGDVTQDESRSSQSKRVDQLPKTKRQRNKERRKAQRKVRINQRL
jgi:hypothetical protein